jgi:hypothetical protein
VLRHELSSCNELEAIGDHKNGFPLMNSRMAHGTISFLTTLYRVVIIIMVVLK